MKKIAFGRIAAAASLTVGVGLLSVSAAGADQSRVPGHALFAETDAPGGNTVVSYLRAGDGTLSYFATFPTFGLGAVALGAVADPLASQGGLSLINRGHDLVATNPGSNTVSVFAVDGPRLRFLQQISSGGSFPTSIAASGDLVAVLNAGASGAVSEFRWDDHALVPLGAQTRSLGLANTPTPFFLDAPGQVGYSPDGSHLVVSTKLSTNAFEVFSVSSDGTLGATPTVSTANNAVPFAFNFDAAGNLVAVEASTSSLSVYRLNVDGTLTSLGSVSDGAHALCWVSSARGYFFGDNAGSASVSSFTEGAQGAPVLVSATAATAHAGTTDSTVSPDSKFLYVESGAAGTIDVFAIGADGSLTALQTQTGLPLASEGIVAS